MKRERGSGLQMRDIVAWNGMEKGNSIIRAKCFLTSMVIQSGEHFESGLKIIGQFSLEGLGFFFCQRKSRRKKCERVEGGGENTRVSM
ncbi:hypothetical protein WAI453_003608 [Rhynchosporium graminicola]